MNKKVIRVTITLNGETFAKDASILTSEQLRTLCTINFGGGSVVPNADIAVYGLPIASMLKLTRVRWRDIKSMMNTIKIEAGDQGSELTTVFEGNITFAYIDMSNAPDVSLKITSSTAALNIYQPSSPITYGGNQSVVGAIQELCGKIGCELENNGVPESLTMTDTTLVDTDLNKIRALCKRYQIDLYIESRSASALRLKVRLEKPRSPLCAQAQACLVTQCLPCRALRFAAYSIQASHLAGSSASLIR